MLQARCDESYLHAIATTSHYVVAGYVASEASWSKFADLWSSTLHELKAARLGYHASDCQRGKGVYARWLESRRRELGYRLAVDIAAARLFPVAAVIEMASYRPHASLFSRFLGPPEHRKYNHAHILAARQCAHQMLLLTENTTEAISFVFDRNKEFGKRAVEWLSKDSGDALIEYRERIGAVHEADRLSEPGLQAADLLAYSTLREFVSDPSWHWKHLNAGVTVEPFVAAEDFWSEIAGNIEARMAGG
ncbi:MAG: DUF3800 domain-containing protein [Thermoanaerobaculia bacterium]